MSKRKLRDEQKGAFFLIIIFLIIVSVGIVLALSLQTDSVAEKLADDQVIRVLNVVNDGDNTALITTVLIFYPVSQKGTVVSVPGNTGAIYQTLGRVDRIDQVYKEKGISAYKQEIEKLLGISIPFYLETSIQNFVSLTDMLGGLRIFIPSPVDIKNDAGDRFLLPSGAVNLDGDKISTYIMYKYSDDSEFDVLDRHQNIICAFYTTLHDKKNRVFTNKKVYKKFLNKMNVNLDETDSYHLMQLISSMDSESMQRQTVTGPARIVDGMRLIFPINNGEFIKEAVKQSTNILISNSSTFASRVYVLEIKNGTAVQGLAHNTSILFQNASYDVLSAVNADRNDYEKTVIIDHIGNKEIANIVGEFIHCTNIVEEEVNLSQNQMESDNTADVDFTIILGKDFDGRYVRASRNEQ
ncbi:MAG: LCP family protein [Treponema sp.]|nr:LCP family protein [Treponema sp.]